jgi:hypothetical protein
MKKSHTFQRIFPVVLAAGLTVLSPSANAKTKKDKPPAASPKDAIEVVGHVPATGSPVTQFLTTQHYSSYYLYAEHGGSNITLVDVTKSDHPAVLADVPSGSLSLVAGTAALATSAAATPAPATQTIKVMDFSDPKNPKVAREFTGVTAMSKDAGRGLIFLSNSEGIWILKQHLAEDPELEKEYARTALYAN